MARGTELVVELAVPDDVAEVIDVLAFEVTVVIALVEDCMIVVELACVLVAFEDAVAVSVLVTVVPTAVLEIWLSGQDWPGLHGSTEQQPLKPFWQT